MTDSTRPARRPRGALAMRPELPAQIFGDSGLRRLRQLLDIDTTLTLDRLESADVEVLVTGWGAPVINDRALSTMPRLRAVIHAAGTVKHHVGPATWDRGIRVTTAADANAYPVAEYTLAMILLAGKHVLSTAERYRHDPQVYRDTNGASTGNFGRTVGIVGASRVGRRVIELLRPFDLEVLVFDPLLRPDDPALDAADSVSLGGLFARSSVVSVHAPLLPDTVGLVGADELSLLPPGATVINTARAPIVDQAALEAAVRERGLYAVLDVTEQEPLPLADPLRALPGVLITPHLAGALGNELRRLGQSAIAEVELYVAGRPAAHPVDKESLSASA